MIMIGTWLGTFCKIQSGNFYYSNELAKNMDNKTKFWTMKQKICQAINIKSTISLQKHNTFFTNYSQIFGTFYDTIEKNDGVFHQIYVNIQDIKLELKTIAYTYTKYFGAV